MRNKWFSTEPKVPEYYKNIRIHADIGMHEHAMSLVNAYGRSGGKALDIGAGAGAFSKRLSDSGFVVQGLDVDSAKWVPADIPFRILDIDKGLRASVDEQFDLICCLEVIEHVENPWNLLREIRDLLVPGGILILSTPNVTSFLSRALFLVFGRMHQFFEWDLVYGHINPVTDLEIETIAKSIGLSVEVVQPGGYLPVFDFASLGPKSLFLNGLRLFARLVGRGQKEGWCLFFVMRRVANVLATTAVAPGT